MWAANGLFRSNQLKKYGTPTSKYQTQSFVPDDEVDDFSRKHEHRVDGPQEPNSLNRLQYHTNRIKHLQELQVFVGFPHRLWNIPRNLVTIRAQSHFPFSPLTRPIQPRGARADLLVRDEDGGITDVTVPKYAWWEPISFQAQRYRSLHGHFYNLVKIVNVELECRSKLKGTSIDGQWREKLYIADNITEF